MLRANIFHFQGLPAVLILIGVVPVYLSGSQPIERIADALLRKSFSEEGLALAETTKPAAVKEVPIKLGQHPLQNIKVVQVIAGYQGYVLFNDLRVAYVQQGAELLHLKGTNVFGPKHPRSSHIFAELAVKISISGLFSCQTKVTC